MDIVDLESMRLTELRNIARDMNLNGFSTMKKQELVFEIMRSNAQAQGQIGRAHV